ncbi:hypothetical protein [Oceanibacterium hippocampi]|uniref:Uncharacterized protein n=1 Tax=Oceanibacterium hippocampi TaxID=745714 RepID=A0A1Y5R7S1_9PROT|nr:hypothetical protein [Oceanibacterium hippocampi]SLN10482.1 hypothetical protein OCH7691_00042 [Oceanibacterium hippocampi]
MQRRSGVCRWTAAALAAFIGVAAASPDGFPPRESEDVFVDRCERQILARDASAAVWARDECRARWSRALAAGPMAEALLAVAGAEGEAVPAAEDARARLPQVHWSTDGLAGRLGDIDVTLAGSASAVGGIAFDWREQGSGGRYNLLDALAIRGVALRTLGCPLYPGASMGREKVMRAHYPGRNPFTLTVYSRPAPTGVEPGLLEVDAAFGAPAPDPAALRAGHYPGGGGRAFAVEPTGWTTDCPDPD